MGTFPEGILLVGAAPWLETFPDKKLLSGGGFLQFGKCQHSRQCRYVNTTFPFFVYDHNKWRA
jgi:hypothetical protein